MEHLRSFSGWPPSRPARVVVLDWRHETPDWNQETFLAYGRGRSYGDCCLNENGILIATRGLDRLISFDAETGLLCCEAGATLADILRVSLPRGWFLPVSPGTQFASVGGAIANDVHGKNHHVRGTFGRWVRRFELLRSDTGRSVCSPQEHAELFQATIGGLGLTGLILWVELQLIPVPGAFLDVEALPFHGLDEFLTLSASSPAWEYTVAWADFASGRNFGRGIFLRGQHCATPAGAIEPPPSPRFTLAWVPPFPLIIGPLVRAFNVLWFQKNKAQKHSPVHYSRFFHPLDALGNWNRLYGPRGFLQYQFVVPQSGGDKACREVLDCLRRSGLDSFLSVMKVFGAVPSPGLLSFPLPGISLCLDFPAKPAVFTLLDKLDTIVLKAGGRVYPAKDARMSPASFQAFFPNWSRLENLRDPRFSSSFWRRVTGDRS